MCGASERAGRDELDAELRDERNGEHRPDQRLADERERNRGAERVPRVDEVVRGPLEWDPFAEVIRGGAEQEAGRDGGRDEVERKREEHRHECELRRHGRARADLELDAREDRVRRDE